MTMERSAQVALTPDGGNNVNHLRVPEYGLVGLHVATDKTSSKCHLPDGTPMSKDWDKGNDDFHFAPEKETIKIIYEIDDACAVIEEAKLELFCRFREAPLWSLDLVKLGPDWYAHGRHVIEWDGRLPEQPAAEQAGEDSDQGLKHKLTALPTKEIKDVFPDGYVTLEHTPYKLKLTVSNAIIRASNAVAWTYFQILIKNIELELGPEEIIPKISADQLARDKAVRKRIADDGGLPKDKDATPRKVLLLSNVYKTALTEMDDNTAYTQLETAWDDGPNIPLIAKIRLADSTDAEVKLESADKGSVALGKAKFLWELEDADEDVDGQQSAAIPNAFLKNAINYYKNGTDATRAAKDHTYPKGDNCHVDRGGKRGPDAKTIFPKQDGYKPKDALDPGKFPFPVMAAGGKDGPKVRLWASYSCGWTSGKLKGQTGVVFQPSRMAGDTYKVSVYLDCEKSKKDEFTFDDKAEPLKAAAAIKASTGVFQIWREVHLARYVRKKGTLAQFFPGSLGGVQAHYRMAYVELVDKMGADNNYVFSDHRLPGSAVMDYNALVRAKLTASGSVFFTANLATDAAADHASEDSMVKVRTYAEFVQQAHRAVNPGAASAGDLALLATAWGMSLNDTSDALGANGTAWSASAPDVRLQATENWLKSWGVETSNKYCGVLGDLCFGIGEPLASDLKLIKGVKHGVGKEAPTGVTFLEFNHTHTYLRDQIAAGVGLRYWYGAAVDPSDAGRDRCMIMFWLAGVDKFSHEFGHHMFLPHATSTSGAPGGVQVDRHDDVDRGCLMSYSPVRPSFCGLCQLRMRGWSATSLDKISAKNKKP